MEFSKTKVLARSFIDALNSLYDLEESWWRKIADDNKNVFILIRKNELRVQANGGLLLLVKQDEKKNLKCKMHEEYLSLRSENDPYVTLKESSTDQIKRVEGLKGFVEHYDKIKRRISIFTSEEKKVVQYLANKVPNIVDIEIGFEGELKENAGKKSVPRIDIAAITDKGTLVFYEVKLFDNSEIHSKETPKVVGQLKKYKGWLAENGEDIITGYNEQLKIYKQLKGRYFEKRAKRIEKIALYPNPRLIITSFDDAQRERFIPSIRDGIKKGFKWMNDSNDLITTGDHKNLATSNRLFLGLE